MAVVSFWMERGGEWTDGVEMEHDSGREGDRETRCAGREIRERRMHELGMKEREDKPEERERKDWRESRSTESYM